MVQEVLRENHWVLVEQPNGNERMVYLKRGNMVELGRYGKFPVEQLIGKPSGLYLEILPKGELAPISPEDVVCEVDMDDVDESRNNQEIFDDNRSQRLTLEEIEKLKEAHAEGQLSASSIIEGIVAGSENFEKKNAFSRIKYIKRKQQKFLKWICPRIPTTRLLADFFTRKDPSRILDCRLDTLSQLLGHANILPGGKYCLWDDSKGYILGAMLERIGPISVADGSATLVVNLYAGGQAQTPFLPNYNLSERVKWAMSNFSCLETGPAPLTPQFFRLGTYGDELPENPTPEYMAYRAKYELRQAMRRNTRACFDNAAFESLVLVCQEHDPCQLLDRWSPFIKSSGKVVIYSSAKEPLLPAFVKLRSSGGFVDVMLTEGWLRPYQTAAGRLHPEMTTNSHGGFLLVATKVTTGQ